MSPLQTIECHANRSVVGRVQLRAEPKFLTAAKVCDEVVERPIEFATEFRVVVAVHALKLGQ